MDTAYEFRITTQIVYGRNTAAKIGDLAGKVGAKKLLLITDKGVSGAGILDCLMGPLKKAGIETVVYDDVEVNPTVQTVDNAYARYSDTDCQGIIAVGGGSPMDTGKSVGVLATNPGSASDYVGVDKVVTPSAPVICVPTTAGTAAEITDVAVLSDPVKKTKLGLRSPHVAPTIALLDPMLTLSLPPGPTRDSGLDALTHAIESYICVNAWSASDALTLRAIELIGTYLRTTVHNGSDIEARDGMLTASLLAGMGFHNTKLCLVHAITGPLGGLYNFPHGASNAIVLPHAMRFMLPGAISKYVDIAIALGENVEGLTERDAAEYAIEAIETMSEDVGLPEGLSVYGAKSEDLPAASETIAESFMVPLSPRRASAEDILKICQAAM
jgi:alcohol dehydrogenase